MTQAHEPIIHAILESHGRQQHVYTSQRLLDWLAIHTELNIQKVDTPKGH